MLVRFCFLVVFCLINITETIIVESIEAFATFVLISQSHVSFRTSSSISFAFFMTDVYFLN
uniref:Uncharacterized protein n=1 Tax=Meloidogyne enterolobii TaxID=390850 RepID=A0A6V7WDV8_MELEN|nr:unnamed protein product [Meloidogyne enterolobii]